MDRDTMSHEPDEADIQVVAAAAVEMTDVDTFCVAMATDEFGEAFGLSFQVALDGEYDDQDRRLGMDTYSISDHFGKTVYGGMLAVSADVTSSVLTIVFAQPVTSTLDLPTTLRFHIPPDKFDEIVDGFRRLLAGEENDIEVS